MAKKKRFTVVQTVGDESPKKSAHIPVPLLGLLVDAVKKQAETGESVTRYYTPKDGSKRYKIETVLVLRHKDKIPFLRIPRDSEGNLDLVAANKTHVSYSPEMMERLGRRVTFEYEEPEPETKPERPLPEAVLNPSLPVRVPASYQTSQSLLTYILEMISDLHPKSRKELKFILGAHEPELGLIRVILEELLSKHGLALVSKANPEKYLQLEPILEKIFPQPLEI